MPPPSLTELQRRLLADPYRLEGEAERPWEPPSVLPDAQRVKRVVDELERGLTPTRPEFLKWICDKLSALPTQTASGLNAAIWADNVIDVAREYPEDLLQAACLHLLKTSTFRPSPAEIVSIIDGKFHERRRMLERAKSLLAPKGEGPKPFEAEPEAVRLRTIIDRAQAHKGSFVSAVLMPAARRAERRLAELENRPVAAWAREETAPSEMGEKINATPVARTIAHVPDGYDAEPVDEMAA